MNESKKKLNELRIAGQERKINPLAGKASPAEKVIRSINMGKERTFKALQALKKRMSPPLMDEGGFKALQNQFKREIEARGMGNEIFKDINRQGLLPFILIDKMIANGVTAWREESRSFVKKLLRLVQKNKARVTKSNQDGWRRRFFNKNEQQAVAQVPASGEAYEKFINKAQFGRPKQEKKPVPGPGSEKGTPQQKAAAQAKE
jgi:hypothetical protein